MTYEIVSKRDADRFVIRDCQTGGMCCCSKYTIKQLIEMGHLVRGVKLNPFNIMFVGGNSSDVPDTKRAATTIAKGLKLKKSRTVKKDDVKKSRLQRSKCVAVLQRIVIEASEYSSRETYYFHLEAYTPAGLTAMRKLAKEYSKHNCGFFVDTDASLELKRRGCYAISVKLNDDLYFENSVQMVCGNCVEVRYDNYYADTMARIVFRSSTNFIPEFTVADGMEANAEIELGSCANGGSSADGYASYFRKCGIIG